MKISRHIFFWAGVITILTLVFGNSFDNPIYSFYFITMLLPIIAGTFYFLNFYLIPKFFHTGMYSRFILYFFYTLVISIYLETLVMVFSLIFIADYNLGRMEPYASDVIVVAMVLYLIVFSGSFLILLKDLRDKQQRILELDRRSRLQEKEFIEVTSDRKKQKIPLDSLLYIESLSDFIKIHTKNSRVIISREKISRIEKMLPPDFLRVHRSYIVNTTKIHSRNYEFVEIEGKEIPVGRTYKKQVTEFFDRRN